MMSTTNRNTTNRNTTGNTTNRNTTGNTTNRNTNRNTTNNQTRKLRNNIDIRNKTIISNYENTIVKQNPLELPITEFIEYIKTLYEPFVTEQEEKRRLKQHEIELTDIFYIPPELLRPEKKDNIVAASFEQNKSMSLDKFIAYTLLFKSFSNFENDGKLKMSDFKNQVGKDVSRVTVKINGVDLPGGIVVEDENRKTADNFNLYIMREMAKNQLLINQNMIIKIDALMCQDIFNFITQTITMYVSNKISPELAVDNAATKNIEIILTNKEQYIIFNYNARLVLTYNQLIDIDRVCGDYSFKLKVDLKNNKYTLNDFNLSYNFDDCPVPQGLDEYSNNDIPTQGQGQNQSKLNQLKDNAYNLVSNNPTAVAGVATTGLLSGTALALFLTGILGGKRKRKQQKQQKITVSKKRKTQRRRRNKTIKKRK